MISDIDVFRVANLMIQRHGGDATAAAEGRAAELADAGDWQGQATWKPIVLGIADVLNDKPAGPLH